MTTHDSPFTIHSQACRLVLDPQPNGGAWNMAVDEVLLEAALAQDETIVRWYRWSEATVSLGYFQQAAAAADDRRLAGLPAVRRMTGGGAILHHHELTYSCAVPPGHPLARDPLALYVEVHRAIIGVLAGRGVSAAMRGPGAVGRDEPFLCFGRGDPRDVIVAGHKVLGSAQRRRRGAVLQHGSLLLEASAFAPFYPGLNELAGRAVVADDARELARAVGRALGGIPQPRELTAAEHEHAARLSAERYSRLDWPRAK